MSGNQRKDGASPSHHNPSVVVNNESSFNIVRKRKAGGAEHLKPLEHDVDRSSKHGKVGSGGSVPFKEPPLVLFGGRTLPGETARNLIAGSSNPRVFGDLEGKAPVGDPISRKAWHPSKTQFANVIEVFASHRHQQIPSNLEDGVVGDEGSLSLTTLCLVSQVVLNC
ncbi:hypothetical protein MHU86_13757 [Fragilaria crotonensis]|nr:hypothetical protein MHU86_13757 [Fragilaria crotonensis]